MSLGLLDHTEAESVPAPTVTMRTIGIIIALFLMVAGGATWVYLRHTADQAKVVAAQKVEREWLVKAGAVIERDTKSVEQEKANLDAVAVANSQPKRTGGKPLRRDQWSAEGRVRYEEVQKEVIRKTSKRDSLISEFNLRLEQYQGPWLPGVKKPDPLKMP